MERNSPFDKILILDFGSQYTQLIARRVRECQIYSEIHSYETGVEAVRSLAPKGIILSGDRQASMRGMRPFVILASWKWESRSWGSVMECS